MTRESVHSRAASVWGLASAQHAVVSRMQLLGCGYSEDAIEHRIAKGRLHRIHHGVYAVGWPELTTHGRWMAAVLACGEGAVLSHTSAASLFRIGDWEKSTSVTVPPRRHPRRRGIHVHRAELLEREVGTRSRIPVTSPARTLIDLAPILSERRLEAAINSADKLRLIDPEALRVEVTLHAGARGIAVLRGLLDRATFVLTESDLERRFLRVARRAGLARPETGVKLNGYVVDFYWRELGLIVETDGLRYHRTAIQQSRDRRRDQAHVAAGFTTLRFTHRQIAHETPSVERTLSAVALKLTARAAA